MKTIMKNGWKAAPHIGLAQLFAQVLTHDFFSNHWQKKPMIGKMSRSFRTADLLNMTDIDGLVAGSTGTDPGWIMMVKEGSNVAPKGLGTADGLIDLDAVYRHYANGYTLILTKVNRRHRELGLFCRGLESFLLNAGCLLKKGLGANVYLTPRGSRGFPTHYDDHDVFIFQLAGSKRWRIYDHLEPSPIKRFEKAIPDNRLPGQLIGTEVGEGDIFYIPRGFYHDAQATDEYSLHVTISIHPLKWMDVVAYMMENRAEFRADVPAPAVPDPGPQLGYLLKGLMRPDAAQQAIADLRSQFFLSLDVFPDAGFSHLNEVPELSPDTLVRRNEGAYSQLVKGPADYALLYPKSGIRVPDGLLDIFRHIDHAKEFYIRDLPDSIDEASKIELVREMINDHFLRTVK